MSTVDRVQASVMGGLLRGRFEPGTWLRQDDLAEELAVSKIPVREALQRLAATGLLRFEANRGAVVPQLTASDAAEIYELRLGIEPRLLDRAIPRLTIVDLAEAEVALQSDHLSLTEANWSFHRSLYRAAGWDRGLGVAETLHVAVAPYVLLYTEQLGGARDSDAEHLALLDACRHGDRATAADLLITHLDQAKAALVDVLDPGDGLSPPTAPAG
ncbi:MAG: GntR family transcriptional regulator [Actinomycetota bacterium]